jgi:hypothetical protein
MHFRENFIVNKAIVKRLQIENPGPDETSVNI